MVSLKGDVTRLFGFVFLFFVAISLEAVVGVFMGAQSVKSPAQKVGGED
jgi:hypothetical protein